eukprot:CCRYP_018093-RA/>CCRYP_018093-RA protein AED:0.02 eAED:0.02 QI:7/1/1/1/0/0/2/431/413
MDLAELSLNEIEHQQQFNDPSPSLTNTQLTSSQKQHKKNLKTELKFQRKVQKLESRIAHAISRKDVAVEQQARKDLDELLRSKTCDHYQSLSTRFPSSDNADGTGSNHVDVVQDAAIKEVTQIFRTLLTSIGKHDRKMAANGSTKEVQNSKARNLLQHMTKGTQTSDMFRDVAALRGYVRKKFHGRASLIIKSFSELSPEALQMACTKPIENMSVSDRLKSQNQRDIMSICYDKLSQIKRVCSIGCGPGNDVVGLISILRTMLSSKMTKPEGGADECSTEITEPQLTEVLLLDFAMKEWNEAALNDLIPILVPRQVRRRLGIRRRKQYQCRKICTKHRYLLNVLSSYRNAVQLGFILCPTCATCTCRCIVLFCRANGMATSSADQNVYAALRGTCKLRTYRLFASFSVEIRVD